jgi:hypothetical protein
LPFFFASFALFFSSSFRFFSSSFFFFSASFAAFLSSYGSTAVTNDRSQHSAATRSVLTFFDFFAILSRAAPNHFPSTASPSKPRLHGATLAAQKAERQQQRAYVAVHGANLPLHFLPHHVSLHDPTDRAATLRTSAPPCHHHRTAYSGRRRPTIAAPSARPTTTALSKRPRFLRNAFSVLRNGAEFL